MAGKVQLDRNTTDFSICRPDDDFDVCQCDEPANSTNTKDLEVANRYFQGVSVASKKCKTFSFAAEKFRFHLC